MKPSTILLTAAENIANNKGSYYACLNVMVTVCNDILKYNKSTKDAMEYLYLFKNPYASANANWFGEPEIKANQEARCLALCFAAQIAFDNGD